MVGQGALLEPYPDRLGAVVAEMQPAECPPVPLLFKMQGGVGMADGRITDITGRDAVAQVDDFRHSFPLGLTAKLGLLGGIGGGCVKT
jgi:hypothetical protein